MEKEIYWQCREPKEFLNYLNRRWFKIDPSCHSMDFLLTKTKSHVSDDITNYSLKLYTYNNYFLELHTISCVNEFSY